MVRHTFGLEMTALILLIIGGINWGFIALFDWDILAGVFGEVNSITRVLYGVIGLAALYRIAIWIRAKTA